MTRSSKKRSRHRIGEIVSGAGMAEAKVFMTGRSQAVRLPKEYRFSGNSVYVKRLGHGVLLLPKSEDRWTGFFAALDEFPRDFTLTRDQCQPVRPGLDKLLADKE